MRNSAAQLREAARMFHQRAGLAYYAHVRHDPLEQLRVRAGRDNPYPVYERIRAAGPLVNDRLGNWLSADYDVCNRVLRDRRFGAVPADRVFAPGEFNLSFLELNPPDHTRLRRLVAPAFGPKQMASYRWRIEKNVHQLLDGVHGTFDLVTALSAPLPIAVISDLLGVPPDRRGDFARYGVTIARALDGVRSMSHARELQATDRALTGLFTELFEQRRRDPSDDVVSRIVAAEGTYVHPHEMVPLCVLLLIGGFETTANLVSNAMLALLDNPDQWAALRADPGLADTVVEEALRFDPPVQRIARFALEDLELDGHPVHRDQQVMTLIGGANRDPAVFTDPARFDITRSHSVEHLAFSGGIHYCIGRPLALLEGTIALTALAERLPALRRAGPVVYRRSTGVRGPLHLPVTA